MLPRTQRLRRTEDIQRAMTSGVRSHGNFLIGHILRTTRPDARFCVVVSAQISKRAVVRNKNRRRISEALRTKIVPNVQSGYDVVIRLKKDASDISHPELLADLRRCLVKIIP